MVSFFGTETSPSSGASSPTIMRNSVVLPDAVRADEADLLAGIELERGVDEEDLPAVLLADPGEGNHYFQSHQSTRREPVHAGSPIGAPGGASKVTGALTGSAGRSRNRLMSVAISSVDALSSARRHAERRRSLDAGSASAWRRRAPAASARRRRATSAARPARARWRGGFPARTASTPSRLERRLDAAGR